MASPLLWVLLCASLALSTGAAGLHLKLTHVDVKENCTAEERMRRATERTHRRLASMGDVTAPVQWAGSVYIAEYLIGDPPRKAQAMIDTGSNPVWTQCATCQPCFNQTLSYYNVSQSSTFRTVSCNDTACGLRGETQCGSDKKSCLVRTAYGSGNISGALGTEVFTFGSEKVSLAFGCIAESEFTSGSLDGASGIIGLGRDPLSLVSQLGATKFSYCLTPYFSDATNTSHLFVGKSASLSGDAPVTSVPFVKSPDDDFPFSSYYYLPLTGITVGETKLDIPAAAFDLRQVAPRQWAGTFIDSGTTLPYLVDVAYQALKAELTRQLGTSLVQPPAETQGLFDLCAAQSDGGKLVPLVLHFGSGGGDMVVPPENYWLTLPDTPTSCMTVLSSAGHLPWPMNETTIIGNYMTQDMHLLYDLGNGVLSFQKADCSSI